MPVPHLAVSSARLPALPAGRGQLAVDLLRCQGNAKQSTDYGYYWTRRFVLG